MDNTYELTRKENNYKAMKENVTKMVNVLSNSDIIDNISMAKNGFKNYYVLNDTPVRQERLQKQKERISNCMNTLRSILNSVDSNLSDIKSDIEKAEKEQENK
ncbi:MAG: hypothetical protein IJ094_08375 [Bacilli bacterium]|nr:hypothetical protein [Bacilli bacterium]